MTLPLRPVFSARFAALAAGLGLLLFGDLLGVPTNQRQEARREASRGAASIESRSPVLLDATLAPVDTLACQPQLVTKSDTLVLSMQASHGGDLGVTGPDSTFYWVVRDWKDLGDVLNASEEFRGLTRLRLPVEDASALPAVYGVDKPKRLFRKAGTYTFHLSEELETNSGTPVAECKVEYQASRNAVRYRATLVHSKHSLAKVSSSTHPSSTGQPFIFEGHVYGKSDVGRRKNHPVEVLLLAVRQSQMAHLAEAAAGGDRSKYTSPSGQVGEIWGVVGTVSEPFSRLAAGHDVTSADGRYRISVEDPGLYYLCVTGETSMPKSTPWTIAGCMGARMPPPGSKSDPPASGTDRPGHTNEQDLYMQFGRLVEGG